jgi:hypothetical protein
LGFAADNVLFFGTGGLAYGHVYADGKVVLNDVDLWDSGQSQTNWGWTIGGGLEYEFDNFIIGAEYLYVDRWKSRCGGRPKVPLEIRKLIRDMSLANPLWGAPRIHGELLELGIDVGQTSVAKYMARRKAGPSQGWRTFLNG